MPDDAGSPAHQPSVAVADYLWSTFIERQTNEHVVVIGMGEPYRGWMHLLSTKESFPRSVSGSVAFVPSGVGDHSTSGGVAVPVVGLTRDHDEGLQRWFFHHSRHFVGQSHHFWNKPRPSKRYGRLVKSEETRLQAMLAAHRVTVLEWIEELSS